MNAAPAVVTGQLNFAGVACQGASVSFKQIGELDITMEGVEDLRPGDRIIVQTEYVIDHSGVFEKHDKVGIATQSAVLEHTAKPDRSTIELMGIQRRSERDSKWTEQHREESV